MDMNRTMNLYAQPFFFEGTKDEAVLLIHGFTGTPAQMRPLGDVLKGDSFLPDDKLNIYPNLQTDFNDSLSFWRSLNEEVRPSLFYYVKFRIESDRRSDDLTRVTGRDLALRKPAG